MILLTAVFLFFGVIFAGNGDEVALAFIGVTVGGLILRLLMSYGINSIINLFRRK